ncbi:hypothetical protein PsorP6_015862 [Peronosclerospora sorghi]|uniref:Uncharacterized protein n=1 Tax=Peronosclerospora sorghi TaxID=230839 RepID=A0ACC0WM45_9STRA|nr:hypothetical protein PsorP6_015862 [Peronosclerospora sorghi]
MLRRSYRHFRREDSRILERIADGIQSSEYGLYYLTEDALPKKQETRSCALGEVSNCRSL